MYVKVRSAIYDTSNASVSVASRVANRGPIPDGEHKWVLIMEPYASNSGSIVILQCDTKELAESAIRSMTATIMSGRPLCDLTRFAATQSASYGILIDRE